MRQSIWLDCMSTTALEQETVLLACTSQESGVPGTQMWCTHSGLCCTHLDRASLCSSAAARNTDWRPADLLNNEKQFRLPGITMMCSTPAPCLLHHRVHLVVDQQVYDLRKAYFRAAYDSTSAFRRQGTCTYCYLCSCAREQQHCCSTRLFRLLLSSGTQS